MCPARIVEIDDIEPGLDLVLVHVVQQRVVSDGGKVVELVIVDVTTVSFGNHLAYVIVYHGIRLARSGRAKHDGGTKGIYYVDPSVMLFSLKAEAGRQVDGILVLQQPGFLLEGFIFDIEHIPHQVMPVKPAHPQSRHQ